MPSASVCTVEVTLQPSDQRLAALIGFLPEDVQYYIISAFATLSLENLKCVSSLNSRYYASFHPRLYHSITLSNEDVHYLTQMCRPPLQSEELPMVVANQQRYLEEYINQYNRFRSICSSARTLSIVGEKILEVIAQMSQQEGATNLFSKLEQLVLRDMKTDQDPGRIKIDLPLEHSIGTILATIQPRKLCLNLGIPFSHTWRNLVQKLAERDLSGPEEIIYHGVPISNLEIEFLILEDVAIQRFFLEDYIIPSYSQTNLKVIYRWASPRNKPHSHRRIPQEIHVYAHWRGSFGLPLELVDSPIEDMWELNKVTHIHQADEKVECECCSSQKV